MGRKIGVGGRGESNQRPHNKSEKRINKPNNMDENAREEATVRQSKRSEESNEPATLTVWAQQKRKERQLGWKKKAQMHTARNAIGPHTCAEANNPTRVMIADTCMHAVCCLICWKP